MLTATQGTIPAMERCILCLVLTAFIGAQAAPEVEITAEPHHHLALANNQVRIFNIEIAPHSETLMHWHRHDYIYVSLGASEVVNAVKGKDPVTVRLQDGQTGFLPGNFAHVARNLSGQPLRSVNIELLQDEKLRSPVHWDRAHPEDDRGLEILHGGTRETLFVKDGVRVSEIELEPGAFVPLQHHMGPHLVVALAACELRSDVSGKSKTAIMLKPGESRWADRSYAQTLTNTGHHRAKFVTLEFR